MKKNKSLHKDVKIDRISISCTNFYHVLNTMSKEIKSKYQKNYISITNTESMYHALRIEGHLNYINSANFSLCDGIGSVIAGKFWGYNIPRLNGPILMLKACDYGQRHGWRHYFYGGKEGVANMMVAQLKKKYPELISVGTYCPPFRPLTSEEDTEVIKIINETKPDIVWVCLGLVKQEKWIADHLNKVNVPWMVGVGAAFDYHAGTVPWAPAWVQAFGMEWLFRTILQPRLRIKRYYWSFIFMFESIWKAIMHRLKLDRLHRLKGKTK